MARSKVYSGFRSLSHSRPTSFPLRLSNCTIPIGCSSPFFLSSSSKRMWMRRSASTVVPKRSAIMARRVGSEDRRVVHLRASAKGAQGTPPSPSRRRIRCLASRLRPLDACQLAILARAAHLLDRLFRPRRDPLLTASLFVLQVVEVSSGNPRLIFPALFSPLRGGLCYFSYGIRARDSHEFI